MSNPAAAKSAFDLKSTAWTLTALRLQTAHLPTLLAALDERFGATPGLFDHDAVVLDFSALRGQDAPPLELPPLLAALRRHGLMPVAVQGASPAQTAAAQAAGLAEALEAAASPAARAPAAAAAPVPAPGRAEPPRMMQPVELREVVHEVEVVREVEVLKQVPTHAMVIDKPLRSGQRVYARHTDLVVLAMVSFGAEVIADGNVHVYGPLRGRAIAGARGNTEARIFSTCCEPQLVSIAGIYRAIETPESLPVHGKPAQVRLDGERILFEPL